jgi:hypothetical protein
MVNHKLVEALWPFYGERVFVRKVSGDAPKVNFQVGDCGVFRYEENSSEHKAFGKKDIKRAEELVSQFKKLWSESISLSIPMPSGSFVLNVVKSDEGDHSDHGYFDGLPDEVNGNLGTTECNAEPSGDEYFVTCDRLPGFDFHMFDPENNLELLEDALLAGINVLCEQEGVVVEGGRFEHGAKDGDISVRFDVINSGRCLGVTTINELRI